jgi:hypothetical protein
VNRHLEGLPCHKLLDGQDKGISFEWSCQQPQMSEACMALHLTIRCFPSSPAQGLESQTLGYPSSPAVQIEKLRFGQRHRGSR